MSVSLYETFQRIDANVKFTAGSGVYTAAKILTQANWDHPAEYALQADRGRLVVYRVDMRGYPIFPPAYVEVKEAAPRVALGAALRATGLGVAMELVV